MHKIIKMLIYINKINKFKYKIKKMKTMMIQIILIMQKNIKYLMMSNNKVVITNQIIKNI